MKCKSQWPVGRHKIALQRGFKNHRRLREKHATDFMKKSSFTYGKFHDDTFHGILGKWQVKHDKIDGLISSEDIASSNEGQKRVGNLSSSSGNDNSHG
jgi:hypothetical protein